MTNGKALNYLGKAVLVVLLAAIAPAGVLRAGLADDALSLMRSGEWEKAEKSLEQDAGRGLFESRLLIELKERRGDREGARAEATRLLNRASLGMPSSAHLYQVAFAAAYLERWREADEIYKRAAELEAVPQSLFVDWGNLYLKKFNAPEAESIFLDGLQMDPIAGAERWGRADLFTGLAASRKEQSRPGFEDALDEAEAVDPTNPTLFEWRARVLIEERDWEKAVEIVHEGLKEAPGYLPLVELEAVISFFRGDDKDYRKALERVERINLRDGRLQELIGDICVTSRRMEDAVEAYSRALELEPRRWSALASRGINRLRLGMEEEGLADLERAYENDPYNIWTVNTLRLVDSFRDFNRFETEHFLVKLHRDESAVLRPYVEALLERSLTTLEQRYEHEIDHRVVFEMYPDHDDFAVRALGLPGLGALGATFGRVVAMDSPSARPPGKFHWASTLWHELAHVVTLSLSKNRVPRWFTEGVSMMEERNGGPGWGDPISMTFIEAYRKGELLPIGDLDSGFLRPRTPHQLSVSYFQAGRVCDYIVDRYGLDVIRKMLVAYSEELSDEEVFKQVLGTDLETFDENFRTVLAAEVEPLLSVLERPSQLSRNEDELRSGLLERPDNFYLNFSLGAMLVETGRFEEAIEPLRRAVKAFPWALEEESPYSRLVQALDRLGREDEAIEVLRDWWDRSPLLAANAIRLGRYYSQKSRLEEAESVLAQAVYSSPLDRNLHRLLGEVLIKKGNYEDAVREYSALLELEPLDRADAHFRLAQAHFGNGDSEQARRQVLLALEIAPGLEEAQELLLKVVRQ